MTPNSFLFAQTAASGDISNSLDSFVRPTGIEQQTLTEATGGSLEVVYQIVGLIFFILTVYAGILWMTAQGKEETITKARNILLAATLGMVAIVSAYAFTQFITSRATDTFSSSGSGATIPSGAINSDTGEQEEQTIGCCVYLNSNRRREFVSDMYASSADCQIDVEAAPGDDDMGTGASDDDDWNFYPDVRSPETCLALDRCWDKGNTEERTSCISNVTSP